MFKDIFLFELAYRSSRPVTYIYFFITLGVAFFCVASPSQWEIGHIHPNAPFVIALWTLILSFLFTIVTSAIMGVSIVRDFEHNMDSILFTTRIRKFEYLF